MCAGGARRDMDALELENLRLKQRERELAGAVAEMAEALRESTKLLLKLRPPRPAIPHDRKLLQARPRDHWWSSQSETLHATT